MFTIFAKVSGTLSGVNYQELDLISGQLETGGIKNLQFAFYLVSKVGETGNAAVVRVGTTRIFEDHDDFSPTQTIFSLTPKKIQDISVMAERQETLS